MRKGTASSIVTLAFVMTAGCEPEPPPQYLPVGGESVIEFERGTFRSSDDSVLTIMTRDTSRTVCSGFAPLGCPGQEHTALRTLVTLRAVAEGDAELRGMTGRDPEIVQSYRVERIQTFEARTIDPSMNDDLGEPVVEGQELTLAPTASVVLQINALGESQVPLGHVESFDVSVLDEAVADVRHGRYSRGWRATITAKANGSTTLRITTTSATRDLALRVQ